MTATTSAVGVDLAGAGGLLLGGGAFAGDGGLALGDALLRLGGAARVLLGELALAFGGDAVLLEALLRGRGARQVLVGLRGACPRLHTALPELRLPPLACRRQGEQHEKDDDDHDDDDQPSLHGTPCTRRAAWGTGESMASVDIDTALAWRGRTVRDPDGEKVGTLGDVYLDRETDLPEWASIRTGLFGRHESHVPLSAIEPAAGGDGDDLTVPFTKDQIRDAPRVDPDVAPTEDEERALYAHYGREYTAGTGTDAPATSDTGDAAEVVRSEEEVEVREGPMKPAERVRLRKVLVTDHEERTIPVRKEVVQLETEPPPSGRIEHVEDVDR